MRRLLGVALATLPLLLLAPASATAAPLDDALDSGVLTYTGTVDYGSRTEAGTVDVTCADGVCTLPWYPEVGDLVFVDGVAIVDVPEGPLDCSNSGDHRGYGGELVLAGTTFTGYYEIIARDVGSCPGFADGLTLPAERTTFDFTLDRGRPCLIDASCEPATAEEALADAAGEFTPGGRNDVALPPGGDRAFATPTEFSQIATFADVFTPVNLAWAGGSTLVLGILVVIPSAWASSAVDRLVGRVQSAWRRRRGLSEETGRTGLRGWAWAASGVGAAAVISAFADPHFGFDVAALRVALSIAAAFALDVLVGWTAAILLVRLVKRDAVPSFDFSPLSLVVVVGAVIVARVSGFEPAIVFGLVAGVAFVGISTVAHSARVALITLGWAYGVGVGAWFLYSALEASDPGLVVVREFLAATTLGGISALPIALLPLRGLPGAPLWAWRKLVWFPVFLIALFSFVVVLLPLPGAWTELTGTLLTWVLGFAAACAVAFVLWLVATILDARDRRRVRAEGVEAERVPV